MGLFDKLFGAKKKDSSGNQELRLEFNVMKNIALEEPTKYRNTEKYKYIEDGIYQDVDDDEDAKYRITISYELELNESNNQYPLDDILNKYLMYVENFLESESDKIKLELGGYLDGMKEAKEIIGKKVFNREFKDENGEVRVKLIIE